MSKRSTTVKKVNLVKNSKKKMIKNCQKRYTYFLNGFTPYYGQKKSFILVLWTVIGGKVGYHGMTCFCYFWLIYDWCECLGQSGIWTYLPQTFKCSKSKMCTPRKLGLYHPIYLIRWIWWQFFQLPWCTHFRLRAFQSFRWPCFCFSTRLKYIPVSWALVKLDSTWEYGLHLG